MHGLGEEVGGDIAPPEIPFASVPALIAARAAIDPARVAVRSRGSSGKWNDLTWGALDERRMSVSGGLAALGVSRGDRVAIVSHNSVEMLTAELAILSVGAISVPIFPDYAPEILQHCLADSGARIALVGSAIQQQRASACKSIQAVVVLDDLPLSGGLPFKALHSGAPVDVPVALDEVAFHLYTSGTTGRPKGVLLTHRNVLSQQAAVEQVWDVSGKDVFLSYLPWHHCFGAFFERFMALWHRALLVLDDSRGRDLAPLLANFEEVKPTVYFSVPRVYQALVRRASSDPAAASAIFHPRLRFVFTAAAPLDAHCYRFFEERGVPVHEGWGLTESSPCATLTRPDSPRVAGVVGWPLPGTVVRLEAVSGFVESGRGTGEILVRGPQVMKGYHRLPSQDVLQHGWLRTGDLGEWTEHGLRVRGRIDGMFKLQNGEKVPSAEVEARILAATPLVEQAAVFGRGQAFVTALCWVSPGVARRFLEERNLDVPDSLPDLCAVPEIRRSIAEALQAANLLAPVHYERVRRVALVPAPLALEYGELTPTMKVVRGAVERRHAALIDALRSEEPHPQVIEVIRRGDAFGNV